MGRTTIDRKVWRRETGFAQAGPWRLCWPVCLLCVLGGSRWLLDEALPSSRSTVLSASMGCALAALAVFAWRKTGKHPGFAEVAVPAPRTHWRASITAGLLLASPALSATVSGGTLGATKGTVALALTPVVVAVAVAASTAAGDLAGLLWPGLAGIAGLLLLLPVPSLSFWRTDLGMATMPLVAGMAAAYLARKPASARRNRSKTGGSYPQWMERGLLLAAVLFSATLLQGIRSGDALAFPWIGGIADGTVLLVTLWTLQRVGAVRWSAQFLLTPLVTILEGAILLRPILTVRSWVGFALLAVGGGYLLLPGSEGERTE